MPGTAVELGTGLANMPAGPETNTDSDQRFTQHRFPCLGPCGEHFLHVSTDADPVYRSELPIGVGRISYFPVESRPAGQPHTYTIAPEYRLGATVSAWPLTGAHGVVSELPRYEGGPRLAPWDERRRTLYAPPAQWDDALVVSPLPVPPPGMGGASWRS